MLGFFEADSVTFVADRAGEFTYTSSLHPEMKGLLVVAEK
jgi:plastocyanin